MLCIPSCLQEGAGAAGLAALLSGQLPELRGKKVVIPLCGGNIDTTVLGRVIERGLAADARLVRFSVIVSDRPGGIAALCKVRRVQRLFTKMIWCGGQEEPGLPSDYDTLS